jgi:hypothetical protein
MWKNVKFGRYTHEGNDIHKAHSSYAYKDTAIFTGIQTNNLGTLDI